MFSYCRLCPLTIECVLLLRMCSGTKECVLWDAEQLVQNRMPYVQWLVEHVAAQLTPEEVKLRRQHGKASGLVEAARRDAEEWARQVLTKP